MRRILMSLVLLVGFAGAQTTFPPADLAGSWSGMATFGNDSLQLHFELHPTAGGWAGSFVCGDEHIPFSSVTVSGDVVDFRLGNGGTLHAKLGRVQGTATKEVFPTLRGEYSVPQAGGALRFWIQAGRDATTLSPGTNEPEDATAVWGDWDYQLIDASGKVAERGTLALAKAKAPRGEDSARLDSPQRHRAELRGVGSKVPQEPTDAQLEEWAKTGHQPTKAELKTVEGIMFSRFDGTQALQLTADLQPDSSLAGNFFANGEHFSFRATRVK